MDQEIRDELLKLQKWFVSKVLTLAGIGLPAEQFREFKKTVFEDYHGHLKPETIRLLELLNARQVQRQFCPKAEVQIGAKNE